MRKPSPFARRATPVLPASLAIAALAVGCGGDDEGEEPLVVSAASSLETAFTEYADEAGIDAKQSFAGSDELAAQIRQGVTPDVYAAADASLPYELHAEGLVSEPVIFAANTLAIGVPEDSEIRSIGDLAEPGVKIAIGAPSVPVGSYTREVIGRLPGPEAEAILDNVRTQEPEVAGIVGKLTQRAVDAGFVYATDVVAAEDAGLRAIRLPASLQPGVAYGAAVVDGAENPEGAREFIEGLLEGDGAEALKRAGFLPPP
ncbi:MAG: molybdate ABC transporter substrate-binding protein [Actinobacteria bacterium]|nr:molybdate ABC transporter substrate-binding protein [Actinomycetota bacterium]